MVHLPYAAARAEAYRHQDGRGGCHRGRTRLEAGRAWGQGADPKEECVDKEIDTEETVGDSRGFSRRTLIKGGAILGGTIWVAPVIDSLTNKAAAQSNANYCCSCWPGLPEGAGLPLKYQGEADEHPPSSQACAAYCLSLGYTNYTWCGPSAAALTYNSNASSPGCYTGPATGLSAATGCVAGATSPYSITATGVPGTYI